MRRACWHDNFCVQIFAVHGGDSQLVAFVFEAVQRIMNRHRMVVAICVNFTIHGFHNTIDIALVCIPLDIAVEGTSLRAIPFKKGTVATANEIVVVIVRMVGLHFFNLAIRGFGQAIQIRIYIVATIQPQPLIADGINILHA